MARIGQGYLARDRSKSTRPPGTETPLVVSADATMVHEASPAAPYGYRPGVATQAPGGGPFVGLLVIRFQPTELVELGWVW
jgi:hypothetical protein